MPFTFKIARLGEKLYARGVLVLEFTAGPPVEIERYTWDPTGGGSSGAAFAVIGGLYLNILRYQRTLPVTVPRSASLATVLVSSCASRVMVTVAASSAEMPARRYARRRYHRCCCCAPEVEMASTHELASLTLTSDVLLAHWQDHRRLTRRVIEAFPERELFEFCVGGMRPFGELALEVIGWRRSASRGSRHEPGSPYIKREPAPRRPPRRASCSSSGTPPPNRSMLPGRRFPPGVRRNRQGVRGVEMARARAGIPYLRALGITLSTSLSERRVGAAGARLSLTSHLESTLQALCSCQTNKVMSGVVHSRRARLSARPGGTPRISRTSRSRPQGAMNRRRRP